MSFSQDIKRELSTISVRTPCCRRALIYGLLYGADINGEEIKTTFTDKYSAELAVTGIRSAFGRNADVSNLRKGGHKYVIVSFSSKCAIRKLSDLWQGGSYKESGIFECGECKCTFLRGVFMAIGCVSDPNKSAHLEFNLSDECRYTVFAEFLTDVGLEPSKALKNSAYRLYYKQRSLIQDVITYTGATQAVFDMVNLQFEKELRNNENRATNCVARNINRSVMASQKQLQLILSIEERGLLESLPIELKTTAKLRIEHAEASLAELAQLHSPPITKSGVNHRLEKITEWCERLGAK